MSNRKRKRTQNWALKTPKCRGRIGKELLRKNTEEEQPGKKNRRKPRKVVVLGKAKRKKCFKGYVSDLTEQLMTLSRAILVEIWWERPDWNGLRSGCK